MKMKYSFSYMFINPCFYEDITLICCSLFFILHVNYACLATKAVGLLLSLKFFRLILVYEDPAPLYIPASTYSIAYFYCYLSNFIFPDARYARRFSMG